MTKREQQTVARFKKLDARLDKMLERDAVTDKQYQGRNVTDDPGTISEARWRAWYKAMKQAYALLNPETGPLWKELQREQRKLFRRNWVSTFALYRTRWRHDRTRHTHQSSQPQVGRLHNAIEFSGKPIISFTMTERKRREIAKLIENEQHLPTCLETFWYPVRGPAWSHADDIHIMHVINGRITGLAQ